MSQFGASAFHVCEVVLNVILELLKGRREAFAKRLTNLGIAIIDREMAKQVAFEIINGVQPNEVDADGMMEILKVHTEAKITCIGHSGDHIGFAGGQIIIQRGRRTRRKLFAEDLNCCKIILLTLRELLVVGTKEISQVCN